MSSTATLNPLSLTYCIPAGSPDAIHIPIIFNNSFPTDVVYCIRNLETGHTDTISVSGTSLKRPPTSHSRLQVTDGLEEEDGSPVDEPLSALVLGNHRSNHHPLEVSKLPSIKPAESLTLVPKDLSSSQTVLFLTAGHLGLITLKSVVDKQGDHFHLAPHHEALVVECPSGGQFFEEHAEKAQKKKTEARPAELRCVGQEEVATFEARGVGSLSVAWKKHSSSATTTGVIEGIEDDDIQIPDPAGLAGKDKVSKTHTVPLRVVHDSPGVFTLGLTCITDSMFNTYVPSGAASEKIYNVLGRPSASFDCSFPKEILEGGKTSIDVVLNEDVSAHASLEARWSFRSNKGSVSEEIMKVTKRRQSIEVNEAGTYSLLELTGPCSGNVMEPSTCEVQRIPPPTVEVEVTTLHEW
jgi:nucleoporin POM152